MRAAVAIVAAFLLAGCPGGRGEDSSQNSPTRNSTTTMNTQAVPEKSGRMNPVVPPEKELPTNRIPAAATNTVQVQLTEYEIKMPDTLAAGHQTLQITNAGKLNHNFAIEGPGVQTKLASDLTRGDSQQIALDLKRGIYNVYCPVDGHRGKGMRRSVVVK